MLVPWLLHVFPTSFSLCEAMVASQGLTLLLTDTTLQLLALVSGWLPRESMCEVLAVCMCPQNDVVVLPSMFSVRRHQALLYVEVVT